MQRRNAGADQFDAGFREIDLRTLAFAAQALVAIARGIDNAMREVRGARATLNAIEDDSGLTKRMARLPGARSVAVAAKSAAIDMYRDVSCCPSDTALVDGNGS